MSCLATSSNRYPSPSINPLLPTRPPNSLWIQGKPNWTQYADVPQGLTISLMAVSSMGGSGYLNFQDADGQLYRYNYFFYPYSQLTFYADRPGRHILSFSVGENVSSSVTIDVTSVPG